MPLTGNALSVKDWTSFSQDDLGLTSYYCFVLMGVGIGKVEADNVGEIVFRTRMLQGIVGNLMTGGQEVADKLESVEFVSRLVGYYANVPTESWAVWSKRVHNIHAGEYQAMAKRLLEAESVLA